MFCAWNENEHNTVNGADLVMHIWLQGALHQITNMNMKLPI